MRTSVAGIAQLVEQLTCNQKVPSSTLGAGTNKKSAQSIDWADFLLHESIYVKPKTQTIRRQTAGS